MTDYRVFPLDDVAVLLPGHDEPLLSIVGVTAVVSELDETPVAIDVPDRMRLQLTIEQVDELCAKLQRAKDHALMVAMRLREMTVH